MILYIAIIVLGGIASFFAPWWVVAPIIFLLSFWRSTSASQAALVGTSALATLWVGYATFLQTTSQVDVAGKVANVLSGGNSFLANFPAAGVAFSVLTLLAGLVGSSAAVAGYHTKKLLLG